MKRWMVLAPLLLVLSGCGSDGAMDAALDFRSQSLGAREVRFSAHITADYIDTAEVFTLSCSVDQAGVLTFEVAEPEEISGITGSVSGDGAGLTFDDTVLAFPMMAQDRLSPVSAPWVVMQAVRSGCIVSVVWEEELLHMTIDDSYADDALTVDLWTREGALVAAEISWEGVRQVCMEISDFVMD